MKELEEALGKALVDRDGSPQVIEVPIGKGIALF